MRASYFVYLLSMLISAFAVSGINFDHFIKKGHVWEARFLSVLLITLLAYGFGSLILAIIEI